MLRAFKLILCLLTLFTCWTNDVLATHNRAGEITYVQLGPLTIRATLTTYTKTSSTAADRDSIDFLWGDGTTQVILRTNGAGTILPNDIKVNYYVAEHTYPGRGTYTMGFLDPNRIMGILNVNYPQSVDVPFFLSSTFTLLDPQFQGINNSAVLLQPPIDYACLGQPYIHNPNAYDADGDSLAYELIAPMQDVGVPVPKYLFPNQILPGPNNVISLNPKTGDLIWNSPPQQGTYNIAFQVKEYRKGVLINSLIRDMQIIIRSCQNRPPEIETIDEICVIAGETIKFDISADDADIGQKVQLTASGGPFVLSSSPAIIIKPDGYVEPKLNAVFEWQTTCDHISPQYYQIVFRAVDNYFADTAGLATLKTVRIKVVGPPPLDLMVASENGSSMYITWEKPYVCEEDADDHFKGFSVWRKLVANPIDIDSCQGGLAGKGYEQIEILTNVMKDGRYFHEDKEVTNGRTYCYRVLGEFGRVSTAGFLYNRVASLASNEACAQLARDLPLITKVSVLETNAIEGKIHLRWTKPLKADFDNIKYPGPYIITISRKAANETNYTLLKSIPLSTIELFSTTDTNYIDIGLNTLALQYEYKIQLYYGIEIIEYQATPTATSVFLNAAPSDHRVLLNWMAQVPWSNYSFNVYRKEGSGSFELIKTTSTETYNDIALENGKVYCYYVEAIGSYNTEDIENPLFNNSQDACTTPIDNIAPCAPMLTVTNFCEDPSLYVKDDLFNDLSWTNAETSCDVDGKTTSYNVYFTSELGQPLALIANVGKSPKRYRHHLTQKSLHGCYAVTALDENGNESVIVDSVCVTNCPVYELPNTFTPNGDGHNEIFKPIKNLFVFSIDMKIYNEWGNLVFTTNDPDINWEGNSNSGNKLTAGTYYYTCMVNEDIGQGNNLLKGFINLIK